MEEHHTSHRAPFYLLQYPWGQRGTAKGKLLPGVSSATAILWIPRKLLQQQICICHQWIHKLPMQMGCDYFHAQLSRLHLQAQHLHAAMRLLCSVVCLGSETRCLRLCSFQWSPTSGWSPALAVEQGQVLPACPHFPRSLHSKLEGQVRRCDSHTQHLEVQTTFQTWVKCSMCEKYPETHQMSLWFSLKAAPWQGPGAVTKGSLHIPTQPCPAAGSPFCSFQASLIQLFIKNTFIFQKLFIFAHLSIITVRYAILEHGFTLIICQLILRAYA